MLPCVPLLSVIILGIPKKDLQSLATSALGFLKGLRTGCFLPFVYLDKFMACQKRSPRCTHMHTPTRSFEPESRGPSIPHRLLYESQLCSNAADQTEDLTLSRAGEHRGCCHE